MRSVRRWAAVAAVAVTLLAAVVVAFAVSASPASAFSDWQHDGAIGCASCHSQSPITNATCTGCHAGFQAYPGDTCWTCHAPGQDTSTLATPSSACSQECHLWDGVQKQYIVPFTHGPAPHLGASPNCLGCHTMSTSFADPGASPHHSGQATGFDQCSACHTKPQRHAGKVACASCHTNAQAFHQFQASSPGFKKCGACHTKRHAGKRVAQGKCVRCHKGSSGRSPQHSSRITRQRVCSACHSKALHASRVSSAVKSCRTCHTGKFHASQPKPPKSTCRKCHSVRLRHDNGFQCTLCHRRAIHNSRPSASN